MKRPGRDDTGRSEAGGAKPPADAVPLRDLIWSHSSIADAIVERLTSILCVGEDGEDSSYPVDIYCSFEKTRIEVTSRGRNNPYLIVRDYWFFLDEERRRRDIDNHDVRDGATRENWDDYWDPIVYEGAIWACDCGLSQAIWGAALGAFRKAVQTGLIKLVGRWGSRRSSFESLPLDAWPIDPKGLMRAGNLDFGQGRLSLDSGEQVFSIHVAPPAAGRGNSAKASARRKAQIKRLTAEFAAEIARSPTVKTVRQKHLIERVMAQGLSKRAALEVWRVATNSSNEIREIWQAQGRPKKNPAPKT